MSQPVSAATSSPPSSPSRVAAASCIGTTIEWYDFFVFSTAAALVFNKVFFPEFSPVRGTLLAIATFGVGFVARPLGAIFFGHFGDKRGRRNMLVITLIVMGTGTFVIGLLPTYGQIGALAPILLVIIRLIQGFAVGGEWGGATLIAVEHAPPRKKALFGSFVPLGSPIGLILATSIFLVVQTLPESAFESYGWRIPFLLSILLVPVGLVIRAKITESPEFKVLEAQPVPVRAPFAVVLRDHWRQLLIGIGAFSGNFAAYYLMTSFVLIYATGTLGLSESLALPTNIIGAVTEGLFILVAAFVSLRIAPRTIAWTGSLGLLIWAFPTYALMRTGEPAALWLSAAVAMAFVGYSLTALTSEVSQLFPTAVRYTGVSMSYHLAGLLGGGLSPFVATLLLGVFGGSIWPVAGFASIMAIVMTVCSLLLPKHPPSERVRTNDAFEPVTGTTH